ncbi:MAG TPA: IscS subfamily cysteine desulfurase [Bacteroidota bacterium]|nr:IscS subfamily cysteine desulfurase [Bacteroidota bacterium]
MKLPIYLDNHATTMVDPRVVEAMIPYLSEQYGNAASNHHEFGWKAGAAVELARNRVAHLIGARNDEIVFTSGATESINLAFKGIAEGHHSKGEHIVTVATEHKAVLDTCKTLEKHGFKVTHLGVDHHGIVSLDDIKRVLTERTILVSVMLANNEIGTIAPLAQIGALCRSRDVLFHSDASQAVGKIPVDVVDLNVDLLSFTGHKMYGPKGIGALYVRASGPRMNLIPQMDGGGHERGLRSGTLNVPAIVGFGKAAELADAELNDDASRTAALRDMLVEGITSSLDDVAVNGHPTERLPHNANIRFRHVKGDILMMDMKDIAVSSGSACSSASPEPSHVLTAIGLSREDVLSSIRFGLGRFTTKEEIGYTIQRVVEVVKSARTQMLHHQFVNS